MLNFDGSNDKIALDTSNASTFDTSTYVLAGALTNNTNIKAVADAATRDTTTLASGGKGGFVYQQDTGELYYSANGDFTGSAELVGVITTDGSTPWTYNFSAFAEVYPPRAESEAPAARKMPPAPAFRARTLRTSLA